MAKVEEGVHDNDHGAAVLEEAGKPFTIGSRPTPKPGANEVLIRAHAVALNPIDYYMRDFGFLITSYPTVVGSDVGGVVETVGSGVTQVKKGDRVAAFAPTLWTQANPDYGALQERMLVPEEYIGRIPASMGFREAAVLPMAVATAFNFFYTAGIPFSTQHKPEDKVALLVSGAASSVGTAGVQIARSKGFVVYATASPQHHAYIKQLGAARVFDYKASGVVEQIVAAAREDGVAISTVYCAAGSPDLSIEVVSALRGDAKGIVASAPVLPEDLPKKEGVEVKFVYPSTDPDERQKQYAFALNTWLPGKLASKEFVPSPAVSHEGSLKDVNAALDKLKAGVSGVKLVLDV